jgi:nickel transport protein
MNPCGRKNFFFRAFPGLRAGAARLLLPAFLFALPAPAVGHSVFIFAWADGARICTESYFSRNNKVQGGNVSMMDMQGNTLFSGRTDSDGTVCFAPPAEARDLKFVVLAGQGHRAEFILPASEMEGMAAVRDDAGSFSPAAGDGGDSASASGDGGPAGREAESSAVLPGLPGLNAEELRAVLREELQRQLAPIRQALAREEKGPELKDVIGGIGWILGLAALGARFRQRRRG